MYLLGFDVGSSSVKASLIDTTDTTQVATVKEPAQEMIIDAPHINWAEQDPDSWWHHLCNASKRLISENNIDPKKIGAIGISYQMHGLVIVDKERKVIRPSIIWCDSRAVDIGNAAFHNIGKEECLRAHMNAPGNFTASKLAWVKDNEPHHYNKIFKAMLPGDYIAMKMTDQICTTISGLSEGILWDFNKDQISDIILDQYGFDKDLFPEVVGTFSHQGVLTGQAADSLGLIAGTPVTYRAGDQPNNAMSLGVLEPGQVAATGGTSGVVYGVIDQKQYDQLSRVNNFAHVNYDRDTPKIGVLLCINGTGIAYNHIRQLVNKKSSYDQLESRAAQIPIGSEGLTCLPFGNGAERMLSNHNIGAQYSGVQFNKHRPDHYVRATLEGIAFSFVYGMKIMQDLGLDVSIIKAGNDNLFQSKIFSQTVSNLSNSSIDLVRTTGAIGAALASGVAIGQFSSINEATKSQDIVTRFDPKECYESQTAYQKWLNNLEQNLS